MKSSMGYIVIRTILWIVVCGMGAWFCRGTWIAPIICLLGLCFLLQGIEYGLKYYGRK